LRLHSLLLVALLASPSGAQSGTTLSGVVHDSIARRPLFGAVVQLVSTDPSAHGARTTVSDSAGRFLLGDVPEGRYLLGFFHPMLDSLGLEPTVREVQVVGRASVVANLGIPSPGRLGAVLCGNRDALESSVVVIGVVRRARDGDGVAEATVIVEALERSATSGVSARRLGRLVARTAENGWFAVCNVPKSGMIALVAGQGTDSTDRVEIEVPSHGFVRRELLLGAPRRLASGGDTPFDDTSSTAGTTLDTVRVTAERARANGVGGFGERRRTGMGRFVTPDDVARLAPLVTSDLFRHVPGIRIDALGLRMRGLSQGECVPPVFVDGRSMRALSADDIDTWVRPDEVAGIEIYAGGRVPPQFQEGMGGCGSIVIWTKPRADELTTASWKSRVLKGIGLTAIGVAIGVFLSR
jgi:hypothetical protein